MQAERKLVTALYADLVDHTAIQTRVDPEEWWKFLRTYGAEAGRPIEQYGGTIEKFIGDAIFAIFGVPQAHEDDAERAVRAAVEVLAVIDRLNARYAARFGAPLRIRLGVATGEAIASRVTESDRLVTGEITSLAERLQSQAPPNAIVLSDRTYALVASLVEAEPITGLTLKGFPGTHRAFVFRRLRVGVTSLRGTGIGAGLVDREREVTLLDQVAERVRRGQGQIVMLFGEAGLGKSRLVSELLSRLPPEMLILQARCHEFMRATAYGTVVQHLRAYFGVLDSDPPDTGRARVHATLLRLAEMTAPVQEALDYLLGLDPSGAFEDRTRGLEPGEVRNQVVRAISALWSQAASQRALGLVVEDLHWMDSASQAAMEAVMQITDHASLLLVAAGRPERLTAAWEFKVAAERDYPHRFQGIQLDPLAPPDTEELAGRLLAQVGLSPEMKGSVATRSEGNPFYVEEIVRSLQEHGRAGDTGLTRLPDTLQGVLQARLDALPETTRQVLQAAAVIGRVFPLRLLQALAELPADLGAHLATLQRTGFLVEQQRLPEPEFAFKHALLQEAAYATLLREARQGAHRRLAKALAQEMAVGANLPVIFEHFVLGAAWAEAVEFGERAAAWAREVGAPEQAAVHYQQTVAMFEAHPQVAPAQTQRRIREAYGDLFSLTGRFEQARAQYEALKTMAATASHRAHAERKLASAYRHEGKLDRAVEHLHEALLVLPPGEDPEEEAWAHLDLGYVEDLTGSDATSVLAHCEQAKLLAAGKAPVLNARVFRMFTIAYVHLGATNEALDSAQRAAEFAAQGTDKLEIAIAHNNLAEVYRQKGELDMAIEHVQRGLEVAGQSERTQATYNIAILHATMGELYLARGAWDAAKRELEPALRSLEAMGPAPRIRVELLLDLVEALIGQGGHGEALKVLDEAQRLCAAYPLHRFVPKLLRLRAEAHLLAGDADQADAACEEGLRAARQFGSDAERPVLLRVRAAVARHQGRFEKVLQCLDEAAAALEPGGQTPELGRVYLERGKTHIARGDVRQAREALDRARAVFARLGAEAFLQEVDHLVVQRA